MTQRADRENCGRIDHVILIYQDVERLKAASAEFSRRLLISDWEEMVEPEQGVHILISWKSGMELLCPIPDSPKAVAYERYLQRHGEGFYAIVFGVDDLDAEVDRAQTEGPVTRLGRPPEPVFATFDVAREALIGQIAHTQFLLGEFVRKPTTSPPEEGEKLATTR